MRNRYTRRKKVQRRRLLVESLENRELLAVDGIRIDLSQNGPLDLLDSNGGGSVQTSYANQGLSLTIGTSNVPGQNNELPVAGPDSATIGQNDPAIDFATSDLIANDSDPDSSDPLQFLGINADNTLGTVTYDDTAGTVTYDPAGQLQFVPGGETAIDTFTYSVADSENGVGTGTVTITVSGINDAPSFEKGADQTVLEDAGAQTIPAWATNITDGDSDTQGLTFEITANTNSELFSAGPAIDSSGNLTFSPAENEFGTATVSVRLTDDGGTSGGTDTSTTATFTITVESVNDAPSIPPREYSATGNVPIAIPEADGLFANVTDVDSDISAASLSSVASTTSGGGLVSGVNLATGQFTYVSAPGFTGVDTFEFTLTDGDASRTQTATVNVSDTIWFVDNSAAAGGDGTLDSPFDSFTPLDDDGNDLDEPGDVIYVAIGSSSYNMTQGGVDELGFELEDNQVLVGEGAAGATLEKWLSDKVGISVADNSSALPPIGSDIESNIAPILTNTTGHVLTVADNNTINGVILDPTASAGINGSDVTSLVVEFVIIITSGGTNDNEGISLQSVSGTLSFNNIDIGSADGGTNTGTAIAIDGGTANLEFNNVDIDQNGGALLSIVNTFASTLQFDENSELTLVGSDQAAVTITGNDGGTVVLNNDDINVGTTATIVFSIVDNTGLQASTPVNDAPMFEIPDVVTVLEDAGAQVTSAFATNISPGLDPDEVGQSVGFSILSNSNPALFDSAPQLAADGTLSYTLAADTIGTADISIQLQDDGGTEDGGIDLSDVKTFSITVTPINDPPSFSLSTDPVSANEDAGPQSVSGFAGNITAGPAHEASQAVTFEIIGNSNPDLFSAVPSINASGELTYTSLPDANGTATITVVLHDDGGTDDGGVDTSASESFQITISPVNDAPSFDSVAEVAVDIHDGAQTIADVVTNLIAGPDNELTQSVSASITDNNNPGIFAVQPSINSSGTLTFTPSAVGTATITVTATDDGGSDDGGLDASTKQLTIVLSEANRPPILDAIGNKSVDEELTLTFTATAFDINGDNLTYSLAGAPTGATISPAGQFSWTPNESQGPENHTFDVVVTDGEFTDTETITVTVGEVNTQPVLAPIGDQSIVEGQTFSFTATASDADLPGNDLRFSLSENAPSGASITPAGEFSWWPTESQGPGSFTFDVVVSDGELSDTETITVAVAEANNDPVLDAIGDKAVVEGQPLTFTATASDTDAPAQDLSFSLSGNVPAGALITAAGQFSWTPTESQGPGSFTFDVAVSDGQAPVSESITVTVGEVNIAPELSVIGGKAVDEGHTLSFTATASDADLPANDLIFSLGGDVPTGAAITPAGEFSFTPSEDQGPGTFTFNIVVSDGELTDSETITVTVNEVGTAPVLEAIGTRTVDEGQSLSFTATATDADVPIDILNFSLSGDVPAGATITPAGQFSFTPTEAQGPQSFTFEVVVSDGTLSDSETISVVVGEVNEAPLLDSIGGQEVNEHETLSFTATASDIDWPANDLFFGLTGTVPAGASITNSGEFSWTPSLSQIPGTYTFDVVVTDGLLTDTETIVVTTQEFNLPPTLHPVGNHAVAEGNELSFLVTATPSHPSEELTFSLTGAPAGAAITNSGNFSWTPTENQGPQTYTFDVNVHGDHLSHTETISVDVTEVNLEVNYEANLTAGFAEFREAEASEQFAFVDLDFNGEDVPLNANSKIYAQMPRDTAYRPFDGWYWEDDHDLKASTPAIRHAGFSLEIEEGDDGLAAFHASLDGTWTVLVDTDGDFDPNNPNEEPSEDAKFTFSYGAANLLQFPPQPTITSPIHGSTVEGDDGVTITWDVGPGPMPDVEVEVQVSNEDANLYFDDLPVSGQSATTPPLPENTPFDVEVVHINRHGDFAANAVAVNGFGSITFQPTISAFASLYGAQFTTEQADFAEFELSLDRIEFAPGNIWHEAFLDVVVFDPRTAPETTVWLKQPTDANFVQQGGGFNGIELDYEQYVDNGQTFQQFIDTLSGVWEVGVDFDGTTDGNNDFDEEFSVAIDLSSFTEASFLDAPTINTPTGTLPAGDRSATITWEPVPGSDFFLVGVSDFIEADVPATTTSFEARWLPTGGELLAFVAAADQRDDLMTLGAGDPPIDAVFFTPTYAPSFFEIPSLPSAVPLGSSQGTYAGGSNSLGGVDYGLKIVTAAANLQANYFSTSEYSGNAITLGGEDRLQQFYNSVQITGNAMQSWQVELVDNADNDVGFAYADLTFSYDDSILDQDFSDLTPAQLEQGLYLYQYDPTSNSWQREQLTSRDTENNKLTIRTDRFSTFVLGYDPVGPGVEPVGDSPVADIEIELIQATLGGESFKQLSIELDTLDPRVDQATVVHVTTPVDTAPRVLKGGWGDEWIDIEAADGQSLADFITTLGGDYDFQFDFDGDGTMDENVSIALDISTINSTLFPTATTPSSPSNGAILPGGQRKVTISWAENTTADFMFAEVRSFDLDIFFFDVDVDATTTSIETEPLPTGIGLDVPLGAFVEANDFAAQTTGTDIADVSFSLGTFTVTSIEIADQVTAVPAGDSSNTIAGGANVIGGVDYALTGVATGGGDLKVEHQPFESNQDVMAFMFGSQGAVDASFPVFYSPGEINQGWRIGLSDAGGAPVTVSEMQLELAYDPALLGASEPNIQAYQWDEAGGTWNQLTISERDTVGHTITVSTSVVANIVLGLPVGSLNAANESYRETCYPAVTTQDLQPLIDEAIARWSATGISDTQIALLKFTSIQFSDFAGTSLGVRRNNTVTLDSDAAGHGWFVDPSPADDVEFDLLVTEKERQATIGEAANRVDLLTTVMHELGHVLGLEHEPADTDDLMSASLDVGTRRLPNFDHADLLADDLISLLAGDVSDE